MTKYRDEILKLELEWITPTMSILSSRMNNKSIFSDVFFKDLCMWTQFVNVVKFLKAVK